jgi:4-hydroxybenzoate polyprenyltransferase
MPARALARLAALASSAARLHIVAIAALGTLTFGWILLGERPWLLAALCAVDWFCVNLLNRVSDLKEDLLNDVRASRFVARSPRAVRASGWAVLTASLVVGHLLAPTTTPVRLAFHALGAAYNRPLLGARLKERYLLKNLASATGFALTLFALPLSTLSLAAGDAPRVGWVAATLCVLWFTLFELAWEVLYDLRDVRGDRAAGVRTFAVVHGERGARRIVDALLAGAFFLALSTWAAGVLPWSATVLAFGAPALGFAYRPLLRRGLTGLHVTALTWSGAGLLAAYHVWIALELPGVTS